jgi:solute:Na+ symporter, SSS family
VWERINIWSEVASMLASIIVAPIVLYITGIGEERGWFGEDPGMTIEAVGLATMAIASTIAAVGVTFITPRTDANTLEGFYERVKPVGFWRRAATGVGEDAGIPIRNLQRDLLRTVVTAVSLFLCLYGFGRLLIPHPQVSMNWPIISQLAGLSLIPIWWRMIQSQRD